MSNSNPQGLVKYQTWLRLIPYAALGMLIFSLTSTTEVNYFFRGYLVLIQAQAGIFVVYFVIAKIMKMRRDKNKEGR